MDCFIVLGRVVWFLLYLKIKLLNEYIGEAWVCGVLLTSSEIRLHFILLCIHSVQNNFIM